MAKAMYALLLPIVIKETNFLTVLTFINNNLTYMYIYTFKKCSKMEGQLRCKKSIHMKYACEYDMHKKHVNYTN